MKPLRLALIVVVCGLTAAGGYNAWKVFRTPAEWRTIGGLGDQKTHKFVEIGPAHAKDRSVYDAAAKSLCKDRPHNSRCTIAFFLPGDKVPEKQAAAVFFKAGGWANYSPLAVFSQNESSGTADFTHWDCDRAGHEGAPLKALCGVKPAYEAVMKLAARAAMAEACGWPKNQDGPMTLDYIAALPDPARRTQFKEAFDKSTAANQKGPANRAECPKLRPKFEEEAEQARRTLGFPAWFDPAAKGTRKPRSGPERGR